MALRNGSMPARAIDYLGTLEAGTRLTSDELAAAIGYEGCSFSQCMAAAVRRGLVVPERSGRKTTWSLPAPEAEEPPTPFNAALWADGDLVIYGAQNNDDNSVTLTAEQVAAVKRLISQVAA